MAYSDLLIWQYQGKPKALATIKMIEDETERETAETIGYYAYFRYVNGFEKALYWSKDKMKQHAMKYSAGYANDIKKGTSYTFWAKDFDAMAKKTMLRQLISKWGVMSVEMQTAYEADNHIINADGTPDYETNTMIDADVPSDAPLPESSEQQIDSDEAFSIDDLAE